MNDHGSNPIAELTELESDVHHLDKRAAEDRVAIRHLDERVTSLEHVVVHLDKTVAAAMRWFVGVSIACTATIVAAMMRTVMK